MGFISNFILMLSVWMSVVPMTCQNSRQKRQILSNQPKLVTENGNLIFMSGASRNITFRTAAGSGIFVNDMDMVAVMNKTNINNNRIAALQRVTQAQDNRIRSLRANMNSTTDQLNSTIARLRQSMQTISDLAQSESNLRSELSNQIAALSQRVTSLETTLSTIQRLLSVNDCSTGSNCQNGGTCIDMYDSFYCLCPLNWRGVHCEEDVNECQKFIGTADGCKNGATCINTLGSYVCQCAHDWYGSHCTEQHDDCEGSNSQRCGHGTCINLTRVQPGQPRYTCACNAGYTLNTLTGQPICVDIDECAPTSGQRYPCSTVPHVNCFNVPGSFYCGPCPQGYEGNGSHCSVSDRCRLNNGGCHPFATCYAPAGYPVSCYCLNGFVGNGIGPMGCTPQSSSAACSSSPCLNGGTCVPSHSNSYSCLCAPGYAGPTCNLVTGPCGSNNPCLNNGTCIAQGAGYVCNCGLSFTGYTCERPQQECSNLEGEVGSLKYPKNGNSYNHLQTCQHRIATRAGKVLRVNFTRFSLERASFCNFDYLEVHDGVGRNAYKYGRFCGNTLQGRSLLTTQNQMTLHFQSDYSVADEGFQLVWTSESPVCGGLVSNQSQGQITSPNYPHYFPAGAQCVWVIAVTPGMSVELQFSQVDLNCSSAFIDVHDGENEDYRLLNKICGNGSPTRVVTSGPVAFVRFNSSYAQPHQGFSISFREKVQGCGGQLFGQGSVFGGQLIKPESVSQGQQLCVWSISVPQNNYIQLTFSSFNLPCETSMFTIHDGVNFTAPIVSRLCGNSVPRPINSTGNTMYIEWRSESVALTDDFFTTWSGACGGRYVGENGTIISPSIYTTNLCTYHIQVPVGKTVKLTFTFVYSDFDEGCNFQTLAAYDGGSISANAITQIACSDTFPTIIRSSGNELYMVINPGPPENRILFRANYSAEGDTALCGGVLNGPYGDLRSPSFPDNYPHNINCTWYISVGQGRHISLTTHVFNLHSYSPCQYSFLKVFDSNTLGRQEIGSYCGSTSQLPVITSSGSSMVVHIETGGPVLRFSFHASYVAVNGSTGCGGSYSSPTGVISSPNYPNGYGALGLCEWTITVDSDKQILVNFTDFRLEDNNCAFDYLEIRNGGFSSSPLLTKLCGFHNQIEPIISHTNRLYFKFVTDHFDHYPGFSLQYSEVASACGGVMTAMTGTIESPHYPIAYPQNTECMWSIQVAEGSRITVAFDANFHVSCQMGYGDFVEIIEGSSNRRGRKLCGDQAPSPITLQTNKIWIKFQSIFRSDVGFRATYFSDCNNNAINGTRGAIESPNFPNLAPSGSQCSWTITVPMGNKISAHFAVLNVVLTEPYSFGATTINPCEDSFVQIAGSNLTTSKLCGTSLPPLFQSIQNQLTITFRTGPHFQSASAFRLEWTIEGCGSLLTQNSGSFSSPNYPNAYNPLQVCIWEIVVDAGKVVRLTITDFDVETHTNCSFDVLEVYSRGMTYDPPIAGLCHTQTTAQTVTSETNHMVVIFKSDNSVHGRGFNATFTAIERDCGGDFSARSGIIQSKNYPNTYDDGYYECWWNITVDEGSTVSLTFTDLNLNCQIGEGVIVGYDYETSYCDMTSVLNRTFISPTNNLMVRMYSHGFRGSDSYRGFRASYTTACGGSRNADVNGEITSPNYPNNYPRGSHCTWTIASTTGAVYITFVTMNITTSENCSANYVTVTSGMGASNLTYCGSTIPHTLYSQGHSMLVQFHTADSYYATASGFKARYSSVLTTCGNEMTAVSGRFASPHYPSEYPDDTECIWQIRTTPGNLLEITFIEFDLSGESNNDYVEIHSPDMNGRTVGRWSGQNTPSNLTQLSGAWILFRSDEHGHSAGFVAEYVQKCGGTLTGSSGQIASLGYPSNYKPLLNCRWRITVQPTERVQIIFHSINIEMANCLYDSVKIYDGDDTTGTLLGTFCGSNLPATLYSSTNDVTVKFVSDSYLEYSGFLLSWTAVSQYMVPRPYNASCGANLLANTSEQVLTSPGYPENYENMLNCLWTISAPLGFSIEVSFQNLSVEVCYDHLNFYDGNSMSSPVLRSQVCRPSQVISPIKSTSNVMTIQFRSDFSIQSSGFALTYQQSCGSVITGVTSGVIQSTNYSNMYPANENCTWTVSVRNGKTIELNFSAPFDIQSTESCRQDYLKLLNGPSLSSPPLIFEGSSNTNGTYCGQVAPQGLKTSANDLYVQFVSDGSLSGAGFSLTFTELSVACGGTLTLSYYVPSGNIVSPNHPNSYPHNVDCAWTIVAPTRKRIRVDFVAPFNIEPHLNCMYDYVEIHDGGSVLSPRLGGPLCGTTLPGTVYSSSYLLYVRFRTDDSATHAGFNLTYSLATCGGRIIGSSGTITSPNFPLNYNLNEECEWEITGTTGHYISFTIVAMILAADTNCSDYVEIRDGNATDSLIYSSCGGQFRTLDTSDNRAYVKFRSDGSLVSQGFQLNFQSSLDECGGQLQGSSGIITSPNFPGLYAHSRTCEWLIQVEPGRKVTLTFSDFSLEYHYNCIYDFVQVFNGIEPDSPQLGKFCGNTIPPTVESSGNTMRIKFRTDMSDSYNGFRATYTSNDDAVCGGELDGVSGYLESPSNITHNIYCVWHISNRDSPETSLLLSFQSFGLEFQQNCAFDFLEIREGQDRTGQLVGRYCGGTRPDDIVIPGGDAWIMYKTDHSVAGIGFNLTYQFSDCGGFRDSPGTIFSPNVRSGRTKACAWKLDADEGTQINMSSLVFDVSCLNGNVSIQNGGLPDSPRVGVYCNNTVPQPFFSQSNQLRVTSILIGNTAGRNSFSLAYAFVSGGCGGHQHGENGTLSSPRYPRSYPHDTECRWDINVDSGYHIQLQFQGIFDMEAHNSCDYDYVQIFHYVENGTEISLGKWCTNERPPLVKSNFNRMLVVFRSDHTTNGLGFSANWSRVCGGQFTAESGVITSPNYPRNYPRNVVCEYKVNPGAQKLIQLRFTDIQMYSGPSLRWRRYYCRDDRVEIQTPTLYSYSRLNTVCTNDQTNTNIYSQGWMTLVFHSTSVVTNRGFSAQYDSMDCGGVLTGSSGLISPQGFHRNFSTASDCVWNITVEPNKVILLKFTQLTLSQTSASCSSSRVDVLDGPSVSSPSLGTFCNMANAGNVLRSTGNSLSLRYIISYNNQQGTFEASYRTSYGPSVGCGGWLNQSEGTLTALDIDHDGRYEPELDCRWHIVVGENKTVSITISNINIDSSPSCQADYLQVLDGEVELGRYCGSRSPVTLTTSSNEVNIVYITDDQSQGSGFTLTYSSRDRVCGGFYNASMQGQVIASPNYPQAYGQPVLCSWVLDTASGDNELRVNVTEKQCSDGAILLVSDKPLTSAGQMVNLCDPMVHDPFYSIGRQARIVYNGSISSNFQLNFSLADCNRNYSQPSGRIISSGFPYFYRHGTVCTYGIQTAENTSLSIYFRRFRLEYGPNCRWDSLQVLNSSSSLERQMCGITIPSPVFLADNMATLVFRSDISIAMDGFDLTYIASTDGQGCGGNLTGLNYGLFTSPGYPGNASLAQTCSWLISPHTTLYFQYIQLSGSSNCATDYVAVYRGPTVISPLISHYCDEGTQFSPQQFSSTILVQFVSSGNGSAPVFQLFFAPTQQELLV